MLVYIWIIIALLHNVQLHVITYVLPLLITVLNRKCNPDVKKSRNHFLHELPHFLHKTTLLCNWLEPVLSVL